MLNFDQYEVLTFDCYGTLIDWETGILSAIRKLLLNHQIDIPANRILELFAILESKSERGDFQNYKSVLRCVIEGFGKELGFIPNEPELYCLVESLKGWQPFPDTVEALQQLKTKYRLSVISNIDDDLFSFSAQHLQLPFDWVITAEQVRSYKPSLNNFISAIETIGVPKGNILHVAQSIHHDIIPAKQIGLSTVWVNRRHDKKGFGATLPAHEKPDLEVPNLAKLVDIIGIS